MALLSVFFAACALLVTAIGLYGTLAYRTARRTSEIGIRMALGAQRLQVVSLVFRQNVAVTVIGALTGLAAALLAACALASFLYGTSTHDPLVLALSTLLLALVAPHRCCPPSVPHASTHSTQSVPNRLHSFFRTQRAHRLRRTGVVDRQDFPYSCLSASTGWTLAARRAGSSLLPKQPSATAQLRPTA